MDRNPRSTRRRSRPVQRRRQRRNNACRRVEDHVVASPFFVKSSVSGEDVRAPQRPHDLDVSVAHRRHGRAKVVREQLDRRRFRWSPRRRRGARFLPASRYAGRRQVSASSAPSGIAAASSTSAPRGSLRLRPTATFSASAPPRRRSSRRPRGSRDPRADLPRRPRRTCQCSRTRSAWREAARDDPGRRLSRARGPGVAAGHRRRGRADQRLALPSAPAARPRRRGARPSGVRRSSTTAAHAVASSRRLRSMGARCQPVPARLRLSQPARRPVLGEPSDQSG